MESENSTIQLEARNLTRHFSMRATSGIFGPKRIVRAVDDVSLKLKAA